MLDVMHSSSESTAAGLREDRLLAPRYSRILTQAIALVFMAMGTACTSVPAVRDARSTADNPIPGTVPAFLSSAQNATAMHGDRNQKCAYVLQLQYVQNVLLNISLIAPNATPMSLS